MQYLTPQELRKIAPATQRMPQSDENLVSTKAFLRAVEKSGYRPVFAAQGTAHADAQSPLKSRHLTVAAHDGGTAVALLNSHSIWRRAWIGAGFVSGDQFMVGAAFPVQRWKGFDEPLSKCWESAVSLTLAKTALLDWKPDVHQTRWLTKQFAESVWLKDHKKPLPKAMLAAALESENALAALFTMLSMARKGGLPPAPTTALLPGRKLKPILSPDALMHAANQAWQVGMRGLRKYGRGDFTFPMHSVGR